MATEDYPARIGDGTDFDDYLKLLANSATGGIYDLARIEENMETIGEFDEVAFGKWKNEYAHPLVVGHIRRRDAS